MYSPKVSANRLAKVTDKVRLGDPTFDPKETSQADAVAKTRELQKIRAKDGSLTRPLTTEEERWIMNELVMSKCSFEYWATRYTVIKTKHAESARLYPLFESQTIIINKIGSIEEMCTRGDRYDGILVAILKARQLGASTLAEAMLGHRAFLYGNTTSLIAADTPDQSEFLFNMFERIYDNLPWWMQPEQKSRVKGTRLHFDKTDSLILVESGRSIRGGSDVTQERGQMARGKTINMAHLSEISTWENPEQIDDALLPSIPRHPRTLAIWESTARGRGNAWHTIWNLAKKGTGRLLPIFIPWYADQSVIVRTGEGVAAYIARAPEGWEPSALGLAHAERALAVSARWCGRTIHLSKDQIYWWETERAAAVEKRTLHKFLAEYCADEGEAFQNTGRSVFPFEVLHDIRQKLRAPITTLEVHPQAYLAGLEESRVLEHD